MRQFLEKAEIASCQGDSNHQKITSIKKIRDQIDKIDSELLQLINQRAMHAMSIAELRGVSQTANFAPERELTIMRALCNANAGPLSNSAITNIFSEIISACRSAKRPLQVAFLGPEGTFSHLAVLRKFGKSALCLPQLSIDDVFDHVEKGLADMGIAPVENSCEGAVSATMDKLIDSSLTICGEMFVPIRHALMSKETSMDRIVEVHSHPQALNQCRKWLRTNVPASSLVSQASTAEAARTTSGRPGAAVVGNEIIASEYNLTILARDIQDSHSNTTRFLLLGKNKIAPTGSDKTSLVFALAHQPGSLHRALGHFAQNTVNLTRIESRPIKSKKWQYFFFVDLDGHQETPVVKKAIEDLKSDVEFMKMLGSYPSGETEAYDS